MICSRENSISSSKNNSKTNTIAAYLSLLLFIGLLFYNTVLDIKNNLIHPELHTESYQNDVQIASLINEHTNQTDLIAVCGNYDNIYNLSNRFSVSTYSYQEPIGIIDPDIMKAFLRDIETYRPTMIVIDHNYSAYDRVIEIINDNYVLVDTVNIKEIYLIKEAE